MAFKKGQPKLENAGRKKGTPNRLTQTLEEKCREKGIDIFEAMLEIAADKYHEKRFECLKELAQYLYPKRKALEVSNGGEATGGFKIVVCDYAAKQTEK